MRVKSLIPVFCVMFALGELKAQMNVWQPSPGHVQIPIRPGAAPDAKAQLVPGSEYVTNTLSPNGVRWTVALQGSCSPAAVTTV